MSNLCAHFLTGRDDTISHQAEFIGERKRQDFARFALKRYLQALFKFMLPLESCIFHQSCARVWHGFLAIAYCVCDLCKNIHVFQQYCGSLGS